MEQVGEEDVEEMEAREVREVPLRRANKSVSLAAGLNRLQAGEGEGEDLPDAEGREGRTSFLHSKCKINSGHNVSSDHLHNKTLHIPLVTADAAHSQSNYNLSETEEKKKHQQKKKSNRISRVIEEFISMGDAISYADKRLSK